MDTLLAIGGWISTHESTLSGAAAIIVLLGVVASALGFIYRSVASSRTEKADKAIPLHSEKVTLKSLSAPAPYAIQFAQSDGLRIAYALTGNGSQNFVMTPGIISHLNIMSHWPSTRGTLKAMGAFARVLCFDKRGQGLSDPTVNVPDLEERVHDIEAVMDAAGMDRTILYGVSEGGPMCLKFAHDHPERVQGLILLGTTARWLQDDDFPMGIEEKALDGMAAAWGNGTLRDIFFPSVSREEVDDSTYQGFERLIASRYASWWIT